jgi:hypothetical protein
MATINIVYNPKVTAFFNSDGNLVINNVTGEYGNGNAEGFGGLNPPISSITAITVSVANMSAAEGYYDSAFSDSIDILAAPYEFVVTNNQIIIDGTAFAHLINFYTLTTTDFESSVLNQGVHRLNFIFQGTFNAGGDTIIWSSGTGFESVFLQDVVNTQSSCLLNIYKSMTDIKCKEKKKFKSLNRYMSMLYNYENYTTQSQLLITDFAKRINKVSDIWDRINKLCTNREGGCKC